MKNDIRMVKNTSIIHHENVTKASRLGFFSSFFFSSLIVSEFWVPKVLNPFSSAPHAILLKKLGGGGVVAAQLAQASW